VLSPTRFNAENRMARFQDEINDKQTQPLLVLSPTRFNAENRMARFQDEINDKQTQPLLVLSPTRVCGIARNVLAF
jgi:hypothetical protein